MPDSPFHLALLAVGLIVLLLVASIGPGLCAVTRLRWSPLEKLCGALVASWILIYLAGFGLFLLNAPAWAYFAVSVLFLAMGFAGRRQLFIFFRNRQTRRVIFAAAIVLIWEFLHLSMVRNFSGGNWAHDGTEHYQRSVYFLHLLGHDFKFIDLYTLPARPPMMNVICAFFLKQTGPSFEAYSICCTFLNGLAFVPCCLLLRFMTRHGARSVFPLVVLFMLNPSIMENATWTITKAFSAGLVVLGVAFYLRAWRTGDATRLMASAITLAAGILIHYSAIPFAAAIAMHYLWLLVRRKRKLSEAVLAAAVVALLLTTWFAYSLIDFGPHQTMSANTTATGITQDTYASALKRFELNLVSCLIPFPIHRQVNVELPSTWNWGFIRDYYFSMSQRTLSMMIGATSGIIAAYLLFVQKWRTRPEKFFWIFFLLFTYIVGTLTNANSEPFGVAHVTAQPLALMGVTFVAAWVFDMPAVLFWILIAGAVVDYLLGILLQFDRQAYVYGVDPNTGNIIPDPTIGKTGVYDFTDKLQNHFVFWGDHLASVSPITEIILPIIALTALWILIRQRRKFTRRMQPKPLYDV